MSDKKENDEPTGEVKLTKKGEGAEIGAYSKEEQEALKEQVKEQKAEEKAEKKEEHKK